MLVNNQPVWTKCSERMPPDDEALYITKMQALDIKYFRMRTGCQINYAWRYAAEYVGEIEWTPYSDELWKELNNERHIDKN